MRYVIRCTGYYVTNYKGDIFLHYPEPNTGRFEGFATSSNTRMIEALNDKYERFQRAGASLVRLETDWDDTMAIGTWPIIRSAMEQRTGKLMQRDLYKLFGRSAEEGTLSNFFSEVWQRFAISTLYEESVGPILEAARENRGGVKEGAYEIYDFCRSRGIPFIIKTASISQVVQAAAEASGIQPDLLIATQLHTCDDCPCGGTIMGSWESMTHVRNKKLDSPALAKIERNRPYVIGIGDGTFDRTMISPNHNNLLVRANPGHEYLGERWGEHLDDSFSGLRLFDEDNGKLFTEYPPYDLVSLEPDMIATNILVREMLRES